MISKILVAYATCTGSTVGVAEAIGKTLAESGAQVDVCPMSELTDISAYQAVVAGSAIHAKQWLPEAVKFVERNRSLLAHKPFAAFLVCMTLAMKNKLWREQAGVEEWLAPVRALVKPVSEGYFSGMLDISKVPSLSDRIKFRVSVSTGVWEEGDHRDWDAIRAWATRLPAAFHS